jgi:putative transposase
MRASMSRKGNCYDNAPIESFWGTLKTELVYHHQYQTRSEAAREIAEYTDMFYNRQRRQARLPITCGLHATVHAATESSMNVTHGVHF